MHPLDKVLQSVAPTVMVPLHGSFEPLAVNGHRFLAAKDGLWLEIRTSWLYLCFPLAQQSTVAMPYGALEPHIDLLYGEPPQRMLERFQEQARVEYPNETAAWITWSKDRGFTYYELDAISAGGSHIRYRCPNLSEGEELVFDLHSHGRHHAFFSKQDDDDDKSGVKIAIVVGHCNASEQDTKTRLCAKGKYIDLGEVFDMLS